MKNSLISTFFKTPLGQVVCGLEASTSSILTGEKQEYEHGQSEAYNIEGHHIKLIRFKINQLHSNGARLNDSQGWIWRIKKINNSKVQLRIFCELTQYSEDIELSPDPGEHLDAIEASDANWILHIGTENGDIMQTRAQMNDWFPTRFKHMLSLEHPITEMKVDGFETNIPPLLNGECLHIHYLVAYDKQDADPESVNTWLAVDKIKSKLENWIGIN